jgi:iron complex transport system ATP-binding protein
VRLEARHLQVRLGQVTILDGVTFDARAGEITAIVGPNGSGKTTLLRALTGEVQVGGSIVLNDRRIDTLQGWELASMRAVLPQSTPLAFPFTVAEVVRLGLSASTSGRDQEAIAAAALSAVDLVGHAGRFYQELSGGEQQRVQLARVLTQVWDPVGPAGPRWLFLDEPVASLDIAHQIAVVEIARAYAARGGGVVAVMHDLNLTAMYAARVTVMSGGLVAGAGPGDEVLRDELLSSVYGCPIRLGVTPEKGSFFLPQACRTA